MNTPHRLVCLLPIVVALAACGAADEGAYPQLLPLDVATADPAVPAHAADAAADPDGVRGELEARAAAAAASRPAPPAAPAALASRAVALRSRADALRATAPGGAQAAAVTCPSGSADPACPPS